jgi:hypothetical protein
VKTALSQMKDESWCGGLQCPPTHDPPELLSTGPRWQRIEAVSLGERMEKEVSPTIRPQAESAIDVLKCGGIRSNAGGLLLQRALGRGATREQRFSPGDHEFRFLQENLAATFGQDAFAPPGCQCAADRKRRCV